MKKLILIALACYGLSARAQVRESRNFLYLFSDSMVYAKDIRLRPDFSGNLRIRVDGKNVPIGQVKFLSSNDGFFANLRKMGIMRTSEFAERIIEGRINVFQESSLSYPPFIYDANHAYEAHFAPTPVPSINMNMYYNKGNADLKNLNYSNLVKDMADNPESMDMLHAYRRSMNSTRMLYVMGAASILGSAITLMSEGKRAYSTANFTMGIGFGALGMGLIGGGYLKQIATRGKLETAVDIYNR